MPGPKPTPPREIDADYSEAEIARRRDELVGRMLNTPPTPQTPKNAQAKKKKKKAPIKA